MYYAIRKVFSAVITIVIISVVVFFIFQIIPGSPILSRLGEEADERQIESLEKEFHLDKPPLERYKIWVIGMLQGDMDHSYRYSVPVKEIISERLPVTVELAVTVMLFTIIIGIPFGIFIAKNDGNFMGTIFSIISQFRLAIPNFWLGIVLMIIFGVWLGWIPIASYVPFSEDPLANLRSILLPTVTLGTGSMAVIIRYLRTAILDESRKDYVRTARSKGVLEKDILYRHIFRNSLIPVVTILGITLIDVLAGSIIVEQVFTIPGMGALLITAIKARDLPLAQGIVMYISFIIVIVNLIVDLLYTLIDPKIKLQKR